jgi:hypothetical protein
MKLRLFDIAVSAALTIDAVGGKQVVNGQIRGNLSKLLTIPQSSPKNLIVSKNLVAKLIT